MPWRSLAATRDWNYHLVMLHATKDIGKVPAIRLQLHPIRTSKQGVQVNVGKDSDEYKSIVNTLSMHENDMKALGVSDGDPVRVRTEHGQAEFVCEKAKVPEGMIFVPYGPPTCLLMGGDTGGTGMPTSKGWEVDVEPVNESHATVE